MIRPPTKPCTERNPTFEDSMNGVAIAGYEMNYWLSWVDKSMRVSGWVLMTNQRAHKSSGQDNGLLLLIVMSILMSQLLWRTLRGRT